MTEILKETDDTLRLKKQIQILEMERRNLWGRNEELITKIQCLENGQLDLQETNAELASQNAILKSDVKAADTYCAHLFMERMHLNKEVFQLEQRIKKQRRFTEQPWFLSLKRLFQ